MGYAARVLGRGVGINLPRNASPYITSFLRGDDFPNAWGRDGQAVRDGDEALAIGALYACTKVITEDVASLPLQTFKYRPDGRGRDRTPEYPLYPLLHDDPNPEMTHMPYFEAMVGHVILWGNHFSQIQTNNMGMPTALWPLRPDKMRLSREDNRLVYLYRLPDGTVTRFDKSEILHVRGMSKNGLVGMSALEASPMMFNSYNAAEIYGWNWFINGSHPSGYLKVQGQLSPEGQKNLKESWEAEHRGLTNSQRVAILEEGVEYVAVGLPPEASQFLETLQYKRTEVCGALRVPPHKIGDLSRSSFSNIEEENIDWVVSGIRPWAVRIEEEIRRQILLDRRYFAEFLLDGLLRGNIESRYRAYAIGLQFGWLSDNEIREKENMNPYEGGDEHYYPLNLGTVGQPRPDSKGTPGGVPGQAPNETAPDNPETTPTQWIKDPTHLTPSLIENTSVKQLIAASRAAVAVSPRH